MTPIDCEFIKLKKVLRLLEQSIEPYLEGKMTERECLEEFITGYGSLVLVLLRIIGLVEPDILDESDKFKLIHEIWDSDSGKNH